MINLRLSRNALMVECLFWFELHVLAILKLVILLIQLFKIEKFELILFNFPKDDFITWTSSLFYVPT